MFFFFSPRGLLKSYLVLLLLRRHNKQFGSRMHYFQFFHDGGRIIRDKELFQIIDDHFVHSYRTQQQHGAAAMNT